MQATYAIKTGRYYTPVTVDTGACQCSSPSRDGGSERIFVGGTGDEAIRKCARDPWTRSYRTLRELQADVDGGAIRRRDLDC